MSQSAGTKEDVVQNTVTEIKWLAIVAVYVALASVSVASARADLTAPNIIEHCRQAYKALKSYHGTTRVLTKHSSGGVDGSYSTMATVQFVRPGKIRVDGTLMSSGRFAFVSDGSHTWETSIGNVEKWESAESTEMAIAAFTGVSQSAATTIPAILVQATWGNPFLAIGAPKVTNETINGRPAHRIDGKSPTGQVTMWIDQKTFLLVKIHQRHDFSHMKTPPFPNAQNRRSEGTELGVMDVTETYTDVRLNESIADSVFTRPNADPH